MTTAGQHHGVLLCSDTKWGKDAVVCFRYSVNQYILLGGNDKNSGNVWLVKKRSKVLLSPLLSLKISMENDYLGPRRIESLRKEDADWQRKAQMAVLSIQDLTVKYFEITAKAQKGRLLGQLALSGHLRGKCVARYCWKTKLNAWQSEPSRCPWWQPVPRSERQNFCGKWSEAAVFLELAECFDTISKNCER